MVIPPREIAVISSFSMLMIDGSGCSIFCLSNSCSVTTLKLNGVFQQIKGLIIGWFEGHEMENKEYNRDVADIILEVTKEYTFPILEIGELGHNVENYVLPIGCVATIDSDKKYFSIDEATVLWNLKY